MKFTDKLDHRSVIWENFVVVFFLLAVNVEVRTSGDSDGLIGGRNPLFEPYFHFKKRAGIRKSPSPLNFLVLVPVTRV